MSNTLKSIESLDGVIHDLRKIGSKMKAGRFIDAHRELGRVTAELVRDRKDILEKQIAKDEE